jgi:hypothetical protein
MRLVWAAQIKRQVRRKQKGAKKRKQKGAGQGVAGRTTAGRLQLRAITTAALNGRHLNVDLVAKDDDGHSRELLGRHNIV